MSWVCEGCSSRRRRRRASEGGSNNCIGRKGMSKKGGFQKDVPWRASSSSSAKPVPKIHHSPILRISQTPFSEYAISVMRVWSISVDLKFLEPVGRELKLLGKNWIWWPHDMTFPWSSSAMNASQNVVLQLNPPLQTTIHLPLSPNIPISHTFSPFISLSNSLPNIRFPCESAKPSNETMNAMPAMSDILEASRAQKLDLQLRTLGPFFRITARSLVSHRELGRAEGVIRLWVGGRILHLDSIKLKRETLGMEKSIFGLGLFIGAVAIRHGYDSGCKTAQLLAINDSHLYHSKLVRFYTRLGFKPVYEVTGSSVGDLAHMLVWGGVGTRMDASVEELMIKWCTRFRPPHK